GGVRGRSAHAGELHLADVEALLLEEALFVCQDGVLDVHATAGDGQRKGLLGGGAAALGGTGGVPVGGPAAGGQAQGEGDGGEQGGGSQGASKVHVFSCAGPGRGEPGGGGAVTCSPEASE